MGNEYDEQMTEGQFVRASFFASDAECEAAKVPPPKRRRRFSDPGIRALAAFARVLESRPLAEQRATIGWLADRFLGIKQLPAPPPQDPA